MVVEPGVISRGPLSPFPVHDHGPESDTAGAAGSHRKPRGLLQQPLSAATKSFAGLERGAVQLRAAPDTAAHRAAPGRRALSMDPAAGATWARPGVARAR